MQVNCQLKVGERRPVGTEPIQSIRRNGNAGNVQSDAAEAEQSAEYLQPVARATEKLGLLLADRDDCLDQ